jgi:hypothetical protein
MTAATESAVSIFTSRGIATMTFNASQLVPNAFDVPPGGGTYFTMYPDRNGSDDRVGVGSQPHHRRALRTSSQNKIDLKHIAVTGCSYSGKWHFTPARSTRRIALVIPRNQVAAGSIWRVMSTGPERGSGRGPRHGLVCGESQAIPQRGRPELPVILCSSSPWSRPGRFCVAIRASTVSEAGRL